MRHTLPFAMVRMTVPLRRRLSWHADWPFTLLRPRAVRILDTGISTTAFVVIVGLLLAVIVAILL